MLSLRQWASGRYPKMRSAILIFGIFFCLTETFVQGKDSNGLEIKNYNGTYLESSRDHVTYKLFHGRFPHTEDRKLNQNHELHFNHLKPNRGIVLIIPGIYDHEKYYTEFKQLLYNRYKDYNLIYVDWHPFRGQSLSQHYDRASHIGVNLAFVLKYFRFYTNDDNYNDNDNYNYNYNDNDYDDHIHDDDNYDDIDNPKYVNNDNDNYYDDDYFKGQEKSNQPHRNNRQNHHHHHHQPQRDHYHHGHRRIVKIITHGFGGVLAGWAASVSLNNKPRISRIIALDPPNQLKKINYNHRLGRHSAYLVEVFHTSIGSGGLPDAIGHRDYYINKGRATQPHCHHSNRKHCSSFKSIVYYTRFGNKEAVHCRNYHYYQANRCRNNRKIRLNNMVSKENYPLGRYYATISAYDEKSNANSTVPDSKPKSKEKSKTKVKNIK